MEKRLSDRLSAPWHPLDALPVGAGAFLAAVLVAGIFSRVFEEGTALLLAGLALEVSFAVLTIVWIRIRDERGIADLRLGAARPVAVGAWGFAMGLALYGITVFVVAPVLYALLSLITGEPIDVPRQEVLPADPEDFHILLGAFVAVVAAPIGEEIFFRGLLHRGLRARMGFWAGALISAAVFAVFHAIPLLMPLFLVVGLGLAYLYERRGTLLAPIAAHMAFNVVGFLFLVFGPT